VERLIRVGDEDGRLMAHGRPKFGDEKVLAFDSMFGRSEKTSTCCRPVEVIVLSWRAGKGLMVTKSPNGKQKIGWESLGEPSGFVSSDQSTGPAVTEDSIA
jgi:hypothetical protein